ncbi:hypothetical protein C3747_140g92 [Trypanosoma cruzi]|uniref:Cleavage and polyadenylation specificity factor subunit 5 n=2 Tax=Trypanosoma cruzi TaxID=5693 RepID=Q4DVL1_TRYCC|nr:hypothetical protein, conserved [Trypanosoma cruzi]EAN96576.1 hypothetical protein, conserved [Trypanosoma cruzi]KAF8301024.1 putative Cleavage factor I 25 kDa subunit [Trypanosoma cruzi]PWV04931.1 hypothetical protein C3747_140g92 [Trypanosoma cruzi]RNC60893.1 hypothetical protein TcCL_ESM01355 [Trypanosoma cruzi]|eukprot:XP_818427.1 hypothetical protein [Trypanosoma cruzi strain CL Brener]
MSLKAKIDVFPFGAYLLQDPSLMRVMQAVVRGTNNTNSSGNMNENSGGGGGAANKRRDAGGNASQSVERRLKTPLEKLMSLKARCREEQCVHSVEGVLLVHVHDHPHVLLLRHANTKASAHSRVLPATNTNNLAVFFLPGGRCRKGEPEEICLLRKLGRDLLNEKKSLMASRTAENESSETVVEVGASHNLAVAPSSSSFRVGEALGRWYRPHFDPFMYPYVPAHVAESDVKEVRTVFLVHLPPQMLLTVAQRDVELVAAPLFDLYENSAKYGPLIASIPTLLSRVNINYCK